ncbi:bactofilin family protein [Hydrogenophaga sp.]|uniref:bactofilin family protein n=1 Tax=Hydrogenophaga sp. TaxID=1904254 RepID=UPI003F6B973F
MKADRYLHPDRHLEQDMDNQTMHPNEEPFDAEPQAGDADEGSRSNHVLEVGVGNAMPPTQPAQMPVLHPQVQSVMSSENSDIGQACSKIAEGLHFIGHAELRGPCSVAGTVEGNLTQAPGAVVSVVVTETGRVKGDITAQKISVMGHTDGILDSGQGEVSLHDTASVHGLVRYGRIQVNGADLNATLERVAPSGGGH